MFNPFIPIFHFYNHWKRQTIKDFFDVLMFSGDVETKNVPWNGLSKSYKAIPSNILTREFPTFLEKQVCGKFETSYSGPYCPSMFQHWINVVSKLWINIEITLIRRWKWNKIRWWIFSVAQSFVSDVETMFIKWFFNGRQHRCNVVPTLIWHFCHVVSTCHQHIKATSKPIWLMICTGHQID